MANFQLTTTSGTVHQFSSNAGDPFGALDGLIEQAVNGGTFYRLPSALVAKAAVESVESA